MLKQGPDFHFETMQLFELSEVEITRVNCSVAEDGLQIAFSFDVVGGIHVGL